MHGWRAYYADGRIFASDVWLWTALPPRGCVGVVVFNEPPYRVILDGFDWIWLEDGEFYVVNTHDEWGEWSEKPDVDCYWCVKQGAGMEAKAWEAMQRRMFEDRIWP